MVRIGWMNMILHGIENPTVVRRDALSTIDVPEIYFLEGWVNGYISPANCCTLASNASE